MSMKTLFLILTLFSFQAYASDYALTFPRDNTFCHFDDKSVEIKIRGFDQYTQMTDGFYGERLFLEKDGNKTFIRMNDNGIGRYRFLRGESQHCGKALSIVVGKSEVAIFLAKDNRPFPDTLLVLYYNFESGLSEVIATNKAVTEASMHSNRLYLRHKGDPCKIETGKVLIEGETYQYVQSEFEPWIYFDGSNFHEDRMKTYKSYEGNLFYYSENDFYKSKGESHLIKIAMNHQLKRKCISFANDSWKCTQITSVGSL